MVAAAFLEIFSVERRTHYPGNAHVGPSCQLSNRINVFKELQSRPLSESLNAKKNNYFYIALLISITVVQYMINC